MFNLDYVINSPKWVHEKGGKRATKITFLLMIHKLFMNFASHPIYYPLSHIRSCFYAFCDTYDCVSLQKNKNHRNEPCNFSRSFFYGAIFRSFISFLFRYPFHSTLYDAVWNVSINDDDVWSKHKREFPFNGENLTKIEISVSAVSRLKFNFTAREIAEKSMKPEVKAG